MLNFEQFTEEVRAAYPGAGVVCATEQPLAVVVDGQPLDTGPLLAVHTSCWLRMDKAVIEADGEYAAQLNVEFPTRANLSMILTIRHGSTLVEETLALDRRGHAALELASTTPGEILVAVKDKPVRACLVVEEV